jgi:hypothetical protein
MIDCVQIETPTYCVHVRLAGDRPHPIHQAKDPHHVVLDV